MKILLIGERYSSNLGDPIICESVKYLILKSFPDAEITFADISGRNEYIENPNNGNALRQGRFSAVKQKISLTATKLGIDTEFIKFSKAHKKIKDYISEICSQDYDMAIFAGGQLFKDSFVFAIADYVRYSGSRNIPVIFNACGVGEIASPRMKSMLADALSNKNVKVITSRDDILTLNEKFLVNASVTAARTYDPALWAPEMYGIQKQESVIVGLGIMFAYNINYNDLIAFWSGIVSELNARKIKWRFFCNGAVKDYEFASHILTELGYSESEKKELLLPRPVRPIDLVKIIAGFSSIISFRLHSHIVAYSLDIPGVAIVWDEKLKHFFSSINLSNRCKNLDDSIAGIVEELGHSIAAGYDNELRERQKNQCRDILVDSIKKNMS